jgi:pheromone a factor receptor
MSLTLLILYTPVSIYFFYINLSIPWLPYSWSAIHDPSSWWTVIYLPELGVRTFDAWVSIAMAVFVFTYFGMGGDALDTYRKWMVKIGLGDCFPRLKEPRRRAQVRGEERSWTSQFSLISRAKHYFDAPRKNSNATATTLGTSIGQ